MEFKDADGFNKALELSGSHLGDQYLTVEEAKPLRSDNRDGWGSGRGGGRSSGGRRGGRDGGGGGRFGGRGGGRGRGRGTPYKPSVTTAATGKLLSMFLAFQVIGGIRSCCAKLLNFYLICPNAGKKTTFNDYD